MCVFHSSQFTLMTRNQAAQPPNGKHQRDREPHSLVHTKLVSRSPLHALVRRPLPSEHESRQKCGKVVDHNYVNR